MTELEKMAKKLDEIYDRLFAEENSFQNRITRLESSVHNCQTMAKQRNDGFLKMKMAVISAVVASIFALVVSWLKK